MRAYSCMAASIHGEATQLLLLPRLQAVSPASLRRRQHHDQHLHAAGDDGYSRTCVVAQAQDGQPVSSGEAFSAL